MREAAGTSPPSHGVTVCAEVRRGRAKLATARPAAPAALPRSRLRRLVKCPDGCDEDMRLENLHIGCCSDLLPAELFPDSIAENLGVAVRGLGVCLARQQPAHCQRGLSDHRNAPFQRSTLAVLPVETCASVAWPVPPPGAQ